MNKITLKRKNEEELFSKIENRHKRMKIEEIILQNISKEDNITIKRRRKKLLTAIHLRKKYKYYCKKHDVTYLVESFRQKTKEYLKERRNDFVQNFRSLQVSENLNNVSEDVNNNCAQKISTNNSEIEELGSRDNNFIVCDQDSPKNSKLLLSKLRKRKLENNLNDNLVNYDADSEEVEPVKPKLPKYVSTENSSQEKNLISYVEPKYHYDNYNKNYCCKHSKTIKSFIIEKNSDKNKIMLTETDDFIESDFDDEVDDCDCSYYEKLSNYFCDYEYDSSTDDNDDDWDSPTEALDFE